MANEARVTNVAEVDLALDVIQHYADQLNTDKTVCTHCGSAKYDQFDEAKTYKSITESVNRIRGLIERRRKRRVGGNSHAPKRSTTSSRK